MSLNIRQTQTKATTQQAIKQLLLLPLPLLLLLLLWSRRTRRTAHRLLNTTMHSCCKAEHALSLTKTHTESVATSAHASHLQQLLRQPVLLQLLAALLCYLSCSCCCWRMHRQA
jgi:hypothetical protein